MRLGEDDKGQTRKAWWLSQNRINKRTTQPPPTGQFEFRIVTSSPGETFTLPLGESNLYIQDFTVYWGDTSSDVITCATGAEKTHTYTSAGTYNIIMEGSCQRFCFDTSSIGDARKVTHLSNIIDMGFLLFSCYDCRNLLSIDSSFSCLSRLTSMTQGFTTCYKITVIPDGMFDGGVDITSFRSCFELCYGYDYIPVGLFDSCTKVTTFYKCFHDNDIIEIPPDIFKYNTLATNFGWCFFISLVITEIPSGVFAHNPLATDFDYCFTSCENLTTIGAGLFDNTPLAKTFNWCFGDNAKLVSVPDELFAHTPLATDFSQCFWRCSSLTTIPAGLFKNCAGALFFTQCFSRCAISAIPTGLFDDCVEVTSMSLCFSDCAISTIPAGLFNNCTKLTNLLSCFAGNNLTSIPSGLFDNCIALTNTSYCFSGNTNITNLPPDLILHNTSLTDVCSMFYNCSSMGGEALPFIAQAEANGVTSHENCFHGCTNLLDYSSIPEDWK